MLLLFSVSRKSPTRHVIRSYNKFMEAIAWEVTAQPKIKPSIIKNVQMVIFLEIPVELCGGRERWWLTYLWVRLLNFKGWFGCEQRALQGQPLLCQNEYRSVGRMSKVEIDRRGNKANGSNKTVNAGSLPERNIEISYANNTVHLDKRTNSSRCLFVYFGGN